MSARQQFPFPQATGNPVSGALFTPDPENPLHATSQGAATPTKKESFLGSGDISGASNDGMFSHQRRPSTHGLSGLIKKTSHPMIDSTPQNAPARPGTADPYSKAHQAHYSNVQKARIPVVAPTPQATYHSSLLSRTTSSHTFKIPSFVDHPNKTMKSVDKHAHISTSDGAIAVSDASTKAEHSSSMLDREHLNDGSNIKFIRGSFQSGPRRILIDDRTGHSVSMTGHEINGEGRIKAVNGRKRSRDEVDVGEGEYSYENPLKRFKPLQDENNANENRSVRNVSPRTERPSSSLSHSGDRRSLDMETRGSPLSQHHAYSDSQSRRFSGSPSRAKPHTPHSSHLGERAPEETRPFAKLLGQDPDFYLEKHMQVYDHLVNKWTNCTMEEWVAGANEVASKYYKILDYVKEHVSTKLKLYGCLHDTVDRHNMLLNEREHVLTAAKKKLVEESGSVLGR